MAGKLEMNHSAPEIVASPEYTLTIPYITISGRSGTGKSHTAELLAESLGVKPENNIKTGALFRESLGQRGITVEGFAKREKEFDAKLDQRQAEYMQTTTVDSPRILEGRLAGIINRELKRTALENNRPIPHGISLLFICEQPERERRQTARKIEEDPQEIIHKNFQRDTGDFAFWQKMHPMLQGKTIENLYDAPKDREGNPTNPLYDIVIDTTNSSVEEVTKNILDLLVQKGLARKE